MTRRALCGKLSVNWKAEGRRAPFGEPMRNETGHEEEVLRRITVDPKIFGGKPIIRGRRLAVEHVLGRSVVLHIDPSGISAEAASLVRMDEAHISVTIEFRSLVGSEGFHGIANQIDIEVIGRSKTGAGSAAFSPQNVG